MKLVFPHMGNAYIPVKVLLDGLGLDYVIPPLSGRKLLEYGVANSPEFICLPFKLVLGDFIYGLENGADVLLFGGSCGQCRQDYYSDLLCDILRGMGYKFKYIHLNLGEMSVKDIMHKLSPLTSGVSRGTFLKTVMNAAWCALEVDKLYRFSAQTRCCELDRGATDRVMDSFVAAVLKAHNFQGVKRAMARAWEELKAIKVKKGGDRLKIALVGEIFIASEPLSNLEIERKLGNMGVEVHNYLSAGMWVREHFVRRLLPFHTRDHSIEAALEFMNTDDIGGHGIETVGNTVISAKNGFDGVIHLYPFTCMPEIIAQCTFGEIQRRYGIPVMTLILDELTGEAGYLTRIEAFVDMLKMRKQAAKRRAVF